MNRKTFCGTWLELALRKPRTDAAAVRDFLSEFLRKEESGVLRDVLIKPMEERGAPAAAPWISGRN